MWASRTSWRLRRPRGPRAVKRSKNWSETTSMFGSWNKLSEGLQDLPFWIAGIRLPMHVEGGDLDQRIDTQTLREDGSPVRGSREVACALRHPTAPATRHRRGSRRWGTRARWVVVLRGRERRQLSTNGPGATNPNRARQGHRGWSQGGLGSGEVDPLWCVGYIDTAKPADRKKQTDRVWVSVSGGCEMPRGEGDRPSPWRGSAMEERWCRQPYMGSRSRLNRPFRQGSIHEEGTSCVPGSVDEKDAPHHGRVRRDGHGIRRESDVERADTVRGPRRECEPPDGRVGLFPSPTPTFLLRSNEYGHCPHREIVQSVDPFEISNDAAARV